MKFIKNFVWFGLAIIVAPAVFGFLTCASLPVLMAVDGKKEFDQQVETLKNKAKFCLNKPEQYTQRTWEFMHPECK